jgi:hypothetical protein
MTKLMTRDDVAEHMQIACDGVWKQCRKMGIPVLDYGHRTKRVRPADLEAAEERMAQGLPRAVVKEARISPLAGKTARAGISTGPRNHS